jgi:hypothetical protein
MLPRFHLGLRWAALVLLAGCSDTISLGSECPQQLGPCVQSGLDASVEPTTVPPPPPVAVVDARVTVMDSARPVPDAGSPVPPMPSQDAGPTSSRALLPALRNRSFEIVDGGAPGAVAAISLVPGTASIQPWHTCQAFAADRVIAMKASTEEALPTTTPDGGAPELVLPRDGRAFVTAQPPVGFDLLVLPLIQKLEEPLRAGQRYAFGLDVRTTGDLAATLLVRGTNGEDGCRQVQEGLTRSEPILSDEWQSLCFEFVPPFDYTHLLLQANFELLSDSSLYFDNLRPLEGCGD